MRFDTVLIANRGEIAIRIIRSARAAGYRTVAVYSDADAGAPHVKLADIAVRIGPAPARDSYLDIACLLDACHRTGAGAVHPGYGFLSERAEFAQACADQGIVFVGPPPAAIRAMGDKAAAKRLMAEAGVPLLQGYQGAEQSDERLLAEAIALGFPLMVKAVAGGGGKGMRLVANAVDLPAAIAAARREARSAFGSDVLLLERALVRPLHVEIQVLADEHGHTITLGERDCSIQRRHQKVVEEAPSPALDAALRAAMSQAAVAAAQRIGYVGAGTVEFLVAEREGAEPTGRTFAFLEMNTRLQVEHPVTELVTGLDLVDLQLRLAQGEPLPLAQRDVRLEGHAIEVRLYAEDPNNDFLPATGRVLRFTPPSGDGVRVDAGIETGSEVSSHYDPMLAKIIARGPDRETARRRLIAALERTSVMGVRTNRAFLIAVLRSAAFVGEVTTAFLDEAGPMAARRPTSAEIAAVATHLHRAREHTADLRSPGLAGWTNRGEQHSTQLLDTGDQSFEVQLAHSARALTVTVDGTAHRIDAGPLRGDALVLDHNRVLVALPDIDIEAHDDLLAAPETGAIAGHGVITAPTHGTVIAALAGVGQIVKPGDPLLIVEAMKMEQTIVADIAGAVTAIVATGQQVATDDLLARIDPSDNQGAMAA